MSDNLRRYRAIHQALKQGYPGEPSGRLAQHLTTLAAFISGIVGSKSSQLPSIATKVPERAKPDSRVKRLSRWLDNDAILEEVYFLPYAEMLLHQLALETLVLVMDGSGVGRGCCALMMHVIYKGRALPLAWRVRQCPKGHFPEDLHIALVELVRRADPGGDESGVPGRWRVRRDKAARDDERGGLVVCLPHVQGQHGDVGRRDVSRQRVGGVYQAGAADRAQGGGLDPRCVWSGDAAVLLGAGACRAVVFGQ